MRAVTCRAGFVLILTLLMSGRAIAQDVSEPWVEEVEIGVPQYFAVLVTSADASAKWYSKVFDLQELERSEADDGSWEIINLKNERLFVEIIRDPRAQEVDRAVGLRKVGFYVPDVRRIADRVERATGERPQVLDFARFGVRIIQIRDPDGTLIQLSSPLESREQLSRSHPIGSRSTIDTGSRADYDDGCLIHVSYVPFRRHAWRTR